jgi:hypothetical protein
MAKGGPIIPGSGNKMAGGGPMPPGMAETENGEVQVGPFILPLAKLIQMVKEGSVSLAASPKDQDSAQKLKLLTKELRSKHGVNIDVEK